LCCEGFDCFPEIFARRNDLIVHEQNIGPIGPIRPITP
jgi:hypothetical protein